MPDRGNTVWDYMALMGSQYDLDREKASPEERWLDAARIVTAVESMGQLYGVSFSDVLEKFSIFRVILQDAGYPGYGESDIQDGTAPPSA